MFDGKQNDASFFLPLEHIRDMRKAWRVEGRTKEVQRQVTDFTLPVGDRCAMFRYGVDFVDGNERLRWTPAGIEKLISIGFWRANSTAVEI